MSVRFLIPVAMLSAALITTAALAQTGGAGGSPGATAPGNPGVQGAGPATPNTTGSGVTAPNATVPNANINPGTGQNTIPATSMTSTIPSIPTIQPTANKQQRLRRNQQPLRAFLLCLAEGHELQLSLGNPAPITWRGFLLPRL
ncbi:MAG: hypothetical protein ACXU8R_08345 [Xanthobacteraceae bacterium]